MIRVKKKLRMIRLAMAKMMARLDSQWELSLYKIEHVATRIIAAALPVIV